MALPNEINEEKLLGDNACTEEMDKIQEKRKHKSEENLLTSDGIPLEGQGITPTEKTDPSAQPSSTFVPLSQTTNVVIPEVPAQKMVHSDGSLQSADVEVACQLQDVVQEDQSKASCRPVSRIVPGKMRYGTWDAIRDLLKNGPSLMNSEDHPEETGVFTTETLTFLDSDSRKEVQKIEKLGCGTFGEVELYCHRDTLFVEKQVKGKLQSNEVLIPITLKNGYILETYGLILRHMTAIILMAYGGKSLTSFVDDREFQEQEIWNLTFQGLSGLAFLHQNGVIHHDIKPDNLLLMEQNGNLFLKLADFGAAKWSSDLNDLEGWTPEYLSPERGWMVMLKWFHWLTPIGNEEQMITGKSDVYSLGLTMCFPFQKIHILQKLVVTDEQNTKNICMIIANVKNPNFAVENIPQMKDKNMRELLTMMLQGDVDKRLTAEETIEKMKSTGLSTDPGTGVKQQSAEDVYQQDAESVYPLQGGSTEVVPDRPEVSQMARIGKTQNHMETDVFVMKQGHKFLGKTKPEKTNYLPFSHLGLNRGTTTAACQDTGPQIPLPFHGDWKKHCDEVNTGNYEQIPDGLRRRITKKKLNDKLAATLTKRKVPIKSTAVSAKKMKTDNSTALKAEADLFPAYEIMPNPSTADEDEAVCDQGNMPHLNELQSNLSIKDT